MWLVIFLIVAAAVVITGAIAIARPSGTATTAKCKPWQEICKSLESHPEEWKISRRFDKAAKPYREKWGLIWNVSHDKAGIKLIVLREGMQYKQGGYTRVAPSNRLFFSEDSKVNAELTSNMRVAIWESIEVALAKKLKANMNPETVEYRDGFFFCPHCGEKVATDIIEQHEPA
jgi:hypothetical protein